MAATRIAVRRRAVLHTRLQSAFRAAIACTVVGCTTLYGPAFIKKHVTFPAFSYVVAVLIVSNAYLGAAVRGCWYALCATLQVVPLTMLNGLNRFSPVVAAVAIMVFSFVVALPKSTDLMWKRIAFGQLVIVYVDAVVHRENSFEYHAVTHPLHVATSTALGAASALLALLLPYPRLAHTEVRKLCGSYAENAAERMNWYLNALSAKNSSVAVELLSKAKPLDEMGNKLLQSIVLIQGGIVWERPWMRFTCPEFVSPVDKLQGIETSFRGMRTALESKLCSNGWANQDMNDIIFDASALINFKVQQARCLLSLKSTVPTLETDKLNLPYKTILSITQDPSACFFLTCVQQFIGDSSTGEISETIFEKNVKQQNDLQEDSASLNFKDIYQSWIQKFSKERFLFALKCSLSLGLAVVVGLTFDKHNGYWSGLTIAIGFGEGRQALFTASNARAQGTALGSVYGVLGCFVFQKYPEIRFLALLPWIFFTTFLRHSRMFGQSGGFSAVIGALLILGRSNYGLANEFAIHRLTGAIIGLSCFILVELLLQPNRASTMVKEQLYLSLVKLQDCIHQLVLSSGSKDHPSIKLQSFRQKNRELKSLVQGLKNLIREAELEPNFWFFPFQGSSYNKVHSSLSNMGNLLSCLFYSLECLLQVAQDDIAPWKELQDYLDNDFNLCKETIGCSLRRLENLSQQPGEKAFHEDHNPDTSGSWTIDIDQAINIARPLQQQAKKVQERLKDVEGDKENKGKVLVSLSVWGYCSSYLIRETKTTETLIKELLHWE